MPTPVLPLFGLQSLDCASSEDRVDDHINGPWRMIYKAVHKLRSISAAGCVSVDWNMRLSALRFLFWHLSYPQLVPPPHLFASSLRLFLAVVLPLLFTLVLMRDRCSPFIFLHFNGKNLFAVCRTETFFWWENYVLLPGAAQWSLINLMIWSASN